MAGMFVDLSPAYYDALAKAARTRREREKRRKIESWEKMQAEFARKRAKP